MAEKMRNLGVRATEAQHRFLRELSLKTGKSVQRLVEDALLHAYDKGRTLTPTAIPSSHTKAHALLDDILGSGDQKAIDWITGNLKMFAEALDARAATAPPRKHGS